MSLKPSLCLAAALALATTGRGADRIAATPPIGGVWWTVVVPALLFIVAFGATLLLYRHFAGRGTGE